MTNNAINNIASDLTVDNLNLDGNTISSLDGNGPIRLKPNTAGNVEVGNLTTDTSVLMQRTDPGKYLGMQDQTSNIGVYTSNGSPENVITADIGSLCTDITHGEFYIKQTNSSATGWSHIGGKCGSTVQIADAYTETYTAFKAKMPTYTLPIITDGQELLRASITPHNINNTLLVSFIVHCGTSRIVDYPAVALFQDGLTNCLSGAGSMVYQPASNNPTLNTLSTSYSMLAGTTNPVTFILRGGTDGGDFNFHLNGSVGGNAGGGTVAFGGKCRSSITIHELLQ